MEFQDNPLTQGKLTVAEINFDIMKTQSVEIFVKLDFFTNDLVVLFIFVYTGSYWEQQLIAPEKKWHFGFDSG